MSELHENVAAYCRAHKLFTPGETILVAVSGGPDSLCLLSVLRRLAEPYQLKLHIAHINHGLRGAEADFDSTFVIDVAWQWNIPITLQKENVAALATKQGLGLEAAARLARYTFLSEVAMAVGAKRIAVGHNANDQAETILMNFIRGSGSEGLSGMRPDTALNNILPQATADTGHMHIIRPLLGTPRPEIEAYCRRHELHPRHDQSNDNLDIFRNRVRHELLPLLTRYNPNVLQAAQRLGVTLQADLDYIQAQIDQHWPGLLMSQSRSQLTIKRQSWQALALSLKRQGFRYAVQQFTGHRNDLTFEHVEKALRLIDEPISGRHLDLPGGLSLTVGYNSFTLSYGNLPQSTAEQPFLPQAAVIPLHLPGSTIVPGTPWQLKLTVLPAEQSRQQDRAALPRWAAMFDAETLGPNPVLRPRQPGDRFYPLGLDGHQQRLKTFMINAKIPIRQRDLIPLLISSGGDIAWVCGWRIDHRFRLTPNSKAIVLAEWHRVEKPPTKASPTPAT